MPSSLNYNFFLYTYIYIYMYIWTDPITLPCSLARAVIKYEQTCIIKVYGVVFVVTLCT